MTPDEKIKTCSEFLSNRRCLNTDSLHVEGIADGQKIVFSHCQGRVKRKYGFIALGFSGDICLDSFNLLNVFTNSGGGDGELLIEKVGDTVFLGTTPPNYFSNFLVLTINSKTLKAKSYHSFTPKTNFITITKVNHDTSYVEGSFGIDIKRDSLPNFVLTQGKFRLKECLEK